jgi:hypothetical protein
MDMLGDHRMWYLYPVQFSRWFRDHIFVLVPCTVVPTWICTQFLRTQFYRVDAITQSPPMDRALWILVILVPSKVVSNIHLCRRYTENKGWVLCFQFWTILKEEKDHVVVCAVVLFCRQSILSQYCTSVLAITVVQACLSCDDSVFKNTPIHPLSPSLLSDNCGAVVRWIVWFCQFTIRRVPWRWEANYLSFRN